MGNRPHQQEQQHQLQDSLSMQQHMPSDHWPQQSYRATQLGQMAALSISMPDQQQISPNLPSGQSTPMNYPSAPPSQHFNSPPASIPRSRSNPILTLPQSPSRPTFSPRQSAHFHPYQSSSSASPTARSFVFPSSSQHSLNSPSIPESSQFQASPYTSPYQSQQTSIPSENPFAPTPQYPVRPTHSRKQSSGSSIGELPPLVRTTQLPARLSTGSTNITSSSGSSYDVTPSTGKSKSPVVVTRSENATLNLVGNLNKMSVGWSHDEWLAKRRLVQFWRRQEGAVIEAFFRPITQEAYVKNSLVISCVYLESMNECFVTSVDGVYLLEGLLGSSFTIEEKNRIRRNLEGFKPLTISKNKPEQADVFRLIMGFSDPKPRNIEKDVKIFPWKIFGDALARIVSKYSASYTVASPFQDYPEDMKAPPMTFAASSVFDPNKGSEPVTQLSPATSSVVSVPPLLPPLDFQNQRSPFFNGPEPLYSPQHQAEPSAPYHPQATHMQAPSDSSSGESFMSQLSQPMRDSFSSISTTSRNSSHTSIHSNSSNFSNHNRCGSYDSGYFPPM